MSTEHVWSTSVTAFVSYLINSKTDRHRQTEWQINSDDDITPPALAELCQNQDRHRGRLTTCVLIWVQERAESNYVATMKTIRQVKTVFIIFIAFVSCWSPYIFVLLYDRSHSLPLPVHLYASMLAHLHASLNFAIYGLMNRNLCPRFAAHLLCCCRGAAVNSNGSSDAMHTTGRGAGYNDRVDANRSFVAVEYHQLQDIDVCSCRNTLVQVTVKEE